MPKQKSEYILYITDEERENMFTNTQNNKIKPIKHPLMRTKATKFGSMFSNSSKTENNDIQDIKSALDRLFYTQSAVRPEPETRVIEVKDEITEYITEDPDEIEVTLPDIKNTIPGKKLPFFKSLSIKLANL